VDTLTLKSIKLQGKHGVCQSERDKGNHFELDIIFRGNFRSAAEKDDLSLTPDYRVAEEIARRIISGPSQYLIETLCKKIGDSIFEAFPDVSELEVVLRKLNPAMDSPVEYAEIRMQWPK
jgi:7,8-dihydroneopterin aldolase/epimerase/oxygenase